MTAKSLAELQKKNERWTMRVDDVVFVRKPRRTARNKFKKSKTTTWHALGRIIEVQDRGDKAKVSWISSGPDGEPPGSVSEKWISVRYLKLVPEESRRHVVEAFSIGELDLDQISESSAAEDMDESPEATNEPNKKGMYEVERAVAARMSATGKVQVLIKWKGYPEDQCSWEPLMNLDPTIGTNKLPVEGARVQSSPKSWPVSEIKSWRNKANSCHMDCFLEVAFWYFRDYWNAELTSAVEDNLQLYIAEVAKVLKRRLELGDVDPENVQTLVTAVCENVYEGDLAPGGLYNFHGHWSKWVQVMRALGKGPDFRLQTVDVPVVICPKLPDDKPRLHSHTTLLVQEQDFLDAASSKTELCFLQLAVPWLSEHVSVCGMIDDFSKDEDLVEGVPCEEIVSKKTTVEQLPRFLLVSVAGPDYGLRETLKKTWKSRKGAVPTFIECTTLGDNMYEMVAVVYNPPGHFIVDYCNPLNNQWYRYDDLHLDGAAIMCKWGRVDTTLMHHVSDVLYVRKQ